MSAQFGASSHGTWVDARISATLDEVAHRAEVTPTLTAVRYGHDSVSYHDLAGALAGYDSVADHNGMAVGSSMAAAILHCLPTIGSLGEPSAVVKAVNQVVEWLGRDLGDQRTLHAAV